MSVLKKFKEITQKIGGTIRDNPKAAWGGVWIGGVTSDSTFSNISFLVSSCMILYHAQKDGTIKKALNYINNKLESNTLTESNTLAELKNRIHEIDTNNKHIFNNSQQGVTDTLLNEEINYELLHENIKSLNDIVEKLYHAEVHKNVSAYNENDVSKLIDSIQKRTLIMYKIASFNYTEFLPQLAQIQTRIDDLKFEVEEKSVTTSSQMLG